MDGQGYFSRPDEIIDLHDEPTHDELTEREQRFLLKAIQEDLDLSDHWQDALNSLRIVLAADELIHTGKVIRVA